MAVETLANSPADVIGQMMIDMSLGTDSDDNGEWPIFVNSEPSTPDNCITVYDTAGIDNGSDMILGRLMQYHGFQVRVRAKTHRAGWLKADEIRANLAESVYQRAVAVEDHDYLVQCIGGIGTVLILGREVGVSKRSLFTVNATATMNQV